MRLIIILSLLICVPVMALASRNRANFSLQLHHRRSSEWPATDNSADGLSKPGRSLLRRSDGFAQRDRAGQERLCTLLRTHDVSRQRKLYRRSARGNLQTRGRGNQRLYVRRSHRLPRDFLEGRPGRDHEDGSRSFHAFEIRAAGVSDRVAGGQG